MLLHLLSLKNVGLQLLRISAIFMPFPADKKAAASIIGSAEYAACALQLKIVLLQEETYGRPRVVR